MNVAFIPMKSTSQRIPHKNVRLFCGKPLCSYTIKAALDSNVFDDVYVVCRDARYIAVAKHYGAKVFERGAWTERPDSRDFDWVFEALRYLHLEQKRYHMFSILRPTSPFRGAETIFRAFSEFRSSFDSLRAVEPVKEHPYKMWVVKGDVMWPLLLQSIGKPEHSSQTQYLPTIYKQNASLEMAWVDTVWDTGTIAGNLVQAFHTEGYAGFDINTWDDWNRAARLVKDGKVTLTNG